MDKFNEEKIIALNEAQHNLCNSVQYLRDTDYVDNKILEAMVSDGDIEALKAEYAEVLAERKRVRESIDGLKEVVESAMAELLK